MDVCFICNDTKQSTAFTQRFYGSADLRVMQAGVDVFEQLSNACLIINANCEAVAQSMSELYVAQRFPEAWKLWQQCVERHGHKIDDQGHSIPVGWATCVCADAQKQLHVIFAPCRQQHKRVEEARDIYFALFAALQLVVLMTELPRTIMCIPVGTGYGCVSPETSANAAFMAVTKIKTNCMKYPPTIMHDNILDVYVLIYNHPYISQRTQIRDEYTFV